jgi:hypothetical protein
MAVDWLFQKGELFSVLDVQELLDKDIVPRKLYDQLIPTEKSQRKSDSPEILSRAKPSFTDSIPGMFVTANSRRFTVEWALWIGNVDDDLQIRNRTIRSIRSCPFPKSFQMSDATSNHSQNPSRHLETGEGRFVILRW